VESHQLQQVSVLAAHTAQCFLRQLCAVSGEGAQHQRPFEGANSIIVSPEVWSCAAHLCFLATITRTLLLDLRLAKAWTWGTLGVGSGSTKFEVLQHVMAAFRTPKIRHLELEIHDDELVTVSLDSESGALGLIMQLCAINQDVTFASE
jgi:hypothetical protein